MTNKIEDLRDLDINCCFHLPVKTGNMFSLGGIGYKNTSIAYSVLPIYEISAFTLCKWCSIMSQALAEGWQDNS